MNVVIDSYMSKTTNIDMESLIELKGKGVSTQALANRFKVSRSTIKRRLKEVSGELPFDKLPANFAVSPEERISEFTLKLAQLAADVPDEYCRMELNRSINKIRQHRAQPKEAKYKKILSSIASGAREMDEIAADCEFLIKETGELLDEMVNLNLVTKQTRGGILNRGRKTKYHYVLIK